jgi:hypothetical protein
MPWYETQPLDFGCRTCLGRCSTADLIDACILRVNFELECCTGKKLNAMEFEPLRLHIARLMIDLLFFST